MHVRPEAAIELQKTLDAERGQQKWHGEAKRIHGEEDNPLDHGVLRCREPKDDCQDWSDARCPAESECKTDYEDSPRRTASFDAVQAGTCDYSCYLEN